MLKPSLFLICLFSTFLTFAQPKNQKSKPVIKDSIEFYAKKGNCQKAITFAQSWLEKAESENLKDPQEKMAVMTKMGEQLLACNKPEEANTIFLQILDNQQKKWGEGHLNLAKIHSNLGHTYWKLEKAEKSEFHFKEAYQIYKNSLGENHLDVATVAFDLGNIYRQKNRFQEAENYYQISLKIRQKQLPEESTEVAGCYGNLGIIYWRTDNLPKAEEFIEKSLKINLKVLGETNMEVANSINNLGLVYIYMGNLSKAEATLLRSLDIMRKLHGENSIRLAPAYNNLGNLNKDLGRYEKSAEYAKKCLEIRLKNLKPNHQDIGSSYNNLCNLHWAIGNLKLAKDYGNKTLEFLEKNLGAENTEVAGILLNLANIYADLKQWEKAEENNDRCIAIRRKIFGEDHPELAPPYLNEAINQRVRGNLAKSEAYLIKANSINMQMVRRFFPSFSDEEKEAFFNTIKPGIEEFQSFATVRYAENPTIAGNLFDHQLATKALLLNSSAKWKQRIKTSGDKKLFLKFTEWENLQNQLAGLVQSTEEEDRQAIDSLKSIAEKLEKELSLRSESFAQLTDKHQATWQEVQQQLKPREAAVEIIRIKKFGIQRTFTDTSDPAKPRYFSPGLTDSAQYVALIVKPGQKRPEMVLLENGLEMEGNQFKFYKSCIRQQLEDKESYNAFWKRIGDKLKGIKTVYFSPDGVYLKLNLNTLKNQTTNKFLLEEIDIRLVTVTRDLIPEGKKEPFNTLAYLIGFPSYYHDFPSKTPSATKKTTANESVQRTNQMLENMLIDLPGTKLEVENIGKILSMEGWEVKSFMEGMALEESLKEIYKPRLLHIATHGYFLDKGEETNPLFRSGLMLSGSGTSLKMGKPEEKEDGILTAFEAMNLNLDNTDLVVLSACETGLGEVKNGEGVYGLQRAFKVAGAKSIMMSLWKVDDEATQELMGSFYKNWLSPTQPHRGGGANTKALAVKGPPSTTADKSGDLGGRKRAAFLAAQKELKAKYTNPYYWGAFVLVGE